MPDIEVLQDVPDELKSRTDTKGEASLRGHLKSDGDEKTGSQSYVPPDAKDDKALKMADDLLHGVKVSPSSAANGDKAANDTGGSARPPTATGRQGSQLIAALAKGFFERAAFGPPFLLRGSLPAGQLGPKPANRRIAVASSGRGIFRRSDSGRSMAETADDLSAPLGQKAARKRRFRLPFTGCMCSPCYWACFW